MRTHAEIHGEMHWPHADVRQCWEKCCLLQDSTASNKQQHKHIYKRTRKNKDTEKVNASNSNLNWTAPRMVAPVLFVKWHLQSCKSHLSYGAALSNASHRFEVVLQFGVFVSSRVLNVYFKWVLVLLTKCLCPRSPQPDGPYMIFH